MSTSLTELPAQPELTAEPSPAAAARTPRVLVVWCPDWPVVAAVAANDGASPPTAALSMTAPIAVIEKGEVYACSTAARVEGVRRGMRRRDASAHCPELVVLDHRIEDDIRVFETVLSAVESVSSAVTPIRPGLCALGVPSRYYGGEQEAAAVVAQQLVEVGVWDCRCGIADGIFAAEQAARMAAAQDSWVVPPGGSREFLAGLSIAALDDHELVSLLRRLGLRRLGDFAALTRRDVVTRFGTTGGWLHRLASGEDGRVAAARRPPLDLDARADFAPGLETIEPIVFSSRRAADHCVAELARHGLVCTEVRIEVLGERGWVGSRLWAHPRWFGSADLVDRLFWQLQGDPATEPVETVRFIPEAVESLAGTSDGLWGSAPDERIERGVARLQGMLGPEQVLAPSVQGGRSPRQRQRLTPWGERGGPSRPATLPWPGSIPPPAPARVFPEPLPATVLTRDGLPVRITGRGGLVGEPGRLRSGSAADSIVVENWAGPWPIDELWWDEGAARPVARFQLVGVDGSAWLLLLDGDSWWIEASYD